MWFHLHLMWFIYPPYLQLMWFQFRLVCSLKRLCLQFPTVNRWENSRAKPSPLAIQKIENLLQEMGEQGQEVLAKYCAK
jgi:hypothetical protein